MLLTHQDDRSPNRPIAKHRGKPDLPLVIALLELRILELPATSLRRQMLTAMIERLEGVIPSRPVLTGKWLI